MSATLTRPIRHPARSASERPCEALVCGAGAAGLAAAAMLKKEGVRALILERSDKVGSAWRRRYDGLRLNSLGWASQLPGLRIGGGARHYPSRDEWVDYLEHYADHHRLAIRFGVEVMSVERLEVGWRAKTSGASFEAPVMVIALGLDRVPYTPLWSGRAAFRGQLLHAAEYRNAEPFRGKEVLVVGPNTSGSELATLIVRAGARRVRLAMRTPPNVATRHWLGLPMHAGTLLLDRLPTALADRLGWAIQRLTVGDLSRYGLPRSPLGLKSTVLERGLGPAFDDGFVKELKQGRIELVAGVESLEERAVVLIDGTRLHPEVVIAATGYRQGLESLVGHLDVLDRDGRPRIQGEAIPCVPGLSGLYFIGYRAGLPGPLRQMRLDARQIARSAGADLRSFKRRRLHRLPSKRARHPAAGALAAVGRQ